MYCRSAFCGEVLSRGLRGAMVVCVAVRSLRGVRHAAGRSFRFVCEAMGHWSFLIALPAIGVMVFAGSVFL